MYAYHFILMASRTYWLDLFSGTTWKEFLEAGGEISGFRQSRWATVQKFKPGDYLLCYLTGVSRFIGILEVTSKPFHDEAPIWSDTVFPARVEVKPIITLTPETAVPIHELRDKLSIFENLKSPHAWTGKLRGSPSKWKAADGEAILQALREAEQNPIHRPVDPKKLARRPRGIKSKLGAVTIPTEEDEQVDQQIEESESLRAHVEIQYRLLKLGNDMGFEVWAAKNDRNEVIDGKKFSEIFPFRDKLPVRFDAVTTNIIEYIDVLWFKGNAIVAAFEVESTTSVYSGLLRMSDLLALQPNLNIPLYLVAPDRRRDKVFREVNRPTFRRFDPPLIDVCRYISFDVLRSKLEEVASVVRYLKPEFIDELCEVCDIEEE